MLNLAIERAKGKAAYSASLGALSQDHIRQTIQANYTEDHQMTLRYQLLWRSCGRETREEPKAGAFC